MIGFFVIIQNDFPYSLFSSSNYTLFVWWLFEARKKKRDSNSTFRRFHFERIIILKIYVSDLISIPLIWWKIMNKKKKMSHIDQCGKSENVDHIWSFCAQTHNWIGCKMRRIDCQLNPTFTLWMGWPAGDRRQMRISNHITDSNCRKFERSLTMETSMYRSNLYVESTTTWFIFSFFFLC